jgi:HD-GYP domain-containing protein (c-di-GMP phosphodiesterase class II)
MNLVPVNVESIRIGHPLPFPLMDKDGTLLAKKTFVIPSRRDLDEISKRGGGLFIDIADSEAHHRAYVERLHDLVRDDKSLGEIAGTQIGGDSAAAAARTAEQEDRMGWLDLQVAANTLLRDRQPASFQDRLARLLRQLQRHSLRNPDGALFALIYLSATDTRLYSATHAMLVNVMAVLAARDVLNWSTQDQVLVAQGALTMNVAMTELQDRLALQAEPLSAAQRTAIHGHAEASAQVLRGMGIGDADWLDIVRTHHTQSPGPLDSRTRSQRIARLIQRADMFAARLAPRAGRTPISPAAAMQACYFDENKAIDEAGAALIKAVGIHQPGSFVRLATEEIAVVIKRGANTSTPRVAVLINRAGLATVEPTIRETSVREHRILASVPHRDVKVQLNLERLLPLTAGPSSDRAW